MTNIDRSRIIYTLEMYKVFGIKYIDQINLDNKDNNRIDLPNNLKELENYINHCNLCTLSNQKDSVLFGSGDINSKIFIIGTNQYFKNSDVYDMFKNMIEKVLLIDINSVYFTNILKCDTNNYKYNLDTIDKSVEICIDYLVKQIELSSVQLIITLGDSYNYIMGTKYDIMDISGKIYDYKGIKLIPIIDPQFLYKNPSYKRQMFNDLKKIKMLME